MATTTIYVLKLENGKYYVGKSDDVNKRFEQHVNGKGSAWTKKHKPILLEKKIENVSAFEEDKVTKEYMAKYGMENVRGGSYVTMDLTEQQEDTLRSEIRGANDACQKCGKVGHFANRCTKKSSFTGTCGCGKKFLDFQEFISHQRLCLPRTTHEESEDEEVEEYECEYCDRTFTTEYGCNVHEKTCKQKKYVVPTSGTCYRCGRYGHWASQCYAKRDVDGEELDSD